jgi:hypothetical protein
MARRSREPAPSRSSLRQEARKLLDEAVRIADSASRKQKLTHAFELVRRAEELPDDSREAIPAAGVELQTAPR